MKKFTIINIYTKEEDNQYIENCVRHKKSWMNDYEVRAEREKKETIHIFMYEKLVMTIRSKKFMYTCVM